MSNSMRSWLLDMCQPKLFQKRKTLDFLLPWKNQTSTQCEQQLHGGTGTGIPTYSWGFPVPRWPQQIQKWPCGVCLGARLLMANFPCRNSPRQIIPGLCSCVNFCARGKIRRNVRTKLQFEKPRALLTLCTSACPSPAFQRDPASLSLPGVPAGLVGVEKPLATNPGVQQLPPACQSVKAFRPDAKRVLGFNLSLRSPIPCQSSPAPLGGPGTDVTRQDAQPLGKISISQAPPRGWLLFASPGPTSSHPNLPGFGSTCCRPWDLGLPRKGFPEPDAVWQQLQQPQGLFAVTLLGRGRCWCVNNSLLEANRAGGVSHPCQLFLPPSLWHIQGLQSCWHRLPQL